VVGNVYFDLTRAFNASRPAVVLASGQAVVYHRVAIMSKDGDWILRETHEACAEVLQVLAARGARYRPGAPLDVRWLAGGWSSHFEFADERGRRVRCDFFSRPPRVGAAAIERLFSSQTDPLRVVDLETLILLKHTQRAKDYAVIAELASRLPPDREIELTTDADRLLALAPHFGTRSTRRAVQAALQGDRDATIVALARETDALQRADRRRLEAYASAAEAYLRAFGGVPVESRSLPEGHAAICAMAERLLPAHVSIPEAGNAHAQ
jgi:hypothetical protein